MRNSRKPLAIFLAFVMFLSLFTLALPAFAAEPEPAVLRNDWRNDVGRFCYREAVETIKFCYSIPEGYVSTGYYTGQPRNIEICLAADNNRDIALVYPGQIRAYGDFNAAFEQFRSLTSVECENFDTSMVQRMNILFRGCHELVEVDVSGWNLSNVVEMDEAFLDCISLKELDFSGEAPTGIRRMYATFRNCQSLEKLNIPGWDLAEGGEMNGTFAYCESLKELDLSSFDFSKRAYYNSPLYGCPSLRKIVAPKYVGDTIELPGYFDCFYGEAGILVAENTNYIYRAEHMSSDNEGNAVYYRYFTVNPTVNYVSIVKDEGEEPSGEEEEPETREWGDGKGDYHVTFTPNEHCTLPQTVDVHIGERDAQVGVDYTYTIENHIPPEKDTAELVVFENKLNGDLSFEVHGIPHTHDFDEDVTLPTCTEEGFTSFVCRICGYSGTDRRVPPNGHSYKAVVTPPTCLAEGFTTYSCENCDASYTADTVPSLGHDYQAEETAPKCLIDGFTTHTCSRCGDSYTDDYVTAPGHTPGAEATCTTPQTCTVCNAVLTAALNHDYQAEVTVPKCLIDGFTTYTCSRCGDSYTDDYVTAPGHTPGAEATCTMPQTCTVCNAVLTAALNHDYQAEVTAPKCLIDGFTTHTCSRCGDSYTDEYVTAPGHTPGAEATCTMPQTCTVCDAVLTAALNHDYQAEVTVPKCLVDGFTTHTCSRCGDSYTDDYVTAPGHTPGAEATCTTPQTCTVCNAVLTTALNHDYQAAVTAPKCLIDGFTTYTCSRCGDSYTDDYVTAPGHTPGAEATCTTPQTCTVCNAVLTAALEHDYQAEVTVPKCLIDGFTTYTCSRCGDSYADNYVTAPGHTPGAEATCTMPQTCTVCDAVLTAALNHDYQAEVTAPRCIIDGFTTYTCSRCGDSYQADYVTAPGHSFGEWEVVTPATATTTGEKARLCTACGFRETKDIPATGLGTGKRTIRFVNIERMDFVVDNNGVEYRIFNSDKIYVPVNADINFRVYLYTTFGHDDVKVYANGVELPRNADGTYTIPAGAEYTVITVAPADAIQPEEPTKTIWQQIKDFFSRIMALFSNLFGSGKSNSNSNSNSNS